ncbi:hypothetical protein [Paraclostridium dentum]
MEENNGFENGSFNMNSTAYAKNKNILEEAQSIQMNCKHKKRSVGNN